ncbi:MOSC domain-containing protein [Quisquiliibacterium transsilvanicum]|uniref:MOSC domain-containing protein YiiM n=1 Tax=Quisquiliibacterium transsilvanicum TaxID=1549638 RepID=A0A7W8HIG6_9BURK|nr:MOSC domain-containing protein [Quisquiliibacterium transsilvanicum]MBB5272674.1 MOSC domain-containing protein YiiM [Quisquiliibacterium transsilvanicum]
MSTSPRLLAVCTGRVAPLVVTERGAPETVISAIAKSPLGSPAAPVAVRVGPLGLEGDEQADLTVHGGLDKAVYVYPVTHYAFWQTVRAQAGVPAQREPSPITGTALPPGTMGENLLVAGLLEADVWIGDRLHIGEVELRVESPRQPCYKFNARMGFKWAVKMMVESGYTGFYCSVLRPGSLCAGDAVQLLPGDRVLSVEQTHRLLNRPKRR